MTSPSWDPARYLGFAAERARPFNDLVARVATDSPRQVVDLGCGPGNATRTLLDRWPDAQVQGVDSSPDMIAKADQAAVPGRLSFTRADITSWVPSGPVDVIIANAVLHWIPGHVELLPGWLFTLRPGGTLAFQVPANADGRAADVIGRVTGSPRWSGAFAGVAASGGLADDSTRVRDAAGYADVLGRLGASVDAWETTYVHLLPGEDPVLAWYLGSGLRPYTDALEGADREAFLTEVAAGLRKAYPRQPYGTPLPFRRVFVVAQV
ncbi:MAG TPA: methyltransferase domain-containing protein [Micromonosporaceae bacterium]|nr:methyltransferase domain-containing protein [Micromonosporaceae bacterium]